MAKSIKRIVPFDEVLAALLDTEHPFPAVFLHRFSDITPQDLEKLKKIWLQISADRRAALMEDLEQLAEADTLVSFDDLGKFGLEDLDSRVRESAVRILWNCEETALIPRLIDLLQHDSQAGVRAAAATSLGQYVYLGEVEDISADHLKSVEEALLAAAQGTDEAIVRRRALESLGYSGRPEVRPLIQTAYDSQDNQWLCSALFAMGRSADQHWNMAVIEMLDHPDSEVQFEAVRAAGELDISAARETLLDLLDSGLDDEETRMAAIWSLSQIGGEGVRERLENLLEESEDDSEIDFLEEALDNLYLTDGFDKFTMFDFEIQDEDELDSVVRLDDEDEDEDAIN